MTVKITQKYELFKDVDGDPLENGYVYVGTTGLNPEVSPITVYFDEALTLPAAQPLRTLGGYIQNAGTPANIYVDTDYSITVRNKNETLIYTSLSNNTEAGLASSVDTVGDLIGLDEATTTEELEVYGYHTKGDSAGGLFIWNSTTSKADANAGTIIDPTVSLANQGTGVGTGCWIRQDINIVNPRMFGAIGDNSTDDTIAMQRLFLAAADGIVMCIKTDTYKVTESLICDFDLNLNGATINFVLDGAKECLSLRDNSSVINGTVDNNGINFAGAGNYQAPIVIGSYQDGTGYKNIKIDKITINGNKPNGNGINITGDSNNIQVSNIDFPDSSTLGRPILMHWGNADNHTSGTTHPYNVNIENIKCGTMTNTSVDGAVIFISSAYNINIKNVFAKKVTWKGGLFSVFSGDYGEYYAATNVKDLIMTNIVAENLSAEEAVEQLAKVDCLSTLAPVNTPLQAPIIRNLSGKAGVTFPCVGIANCFNGSLENSNINNGIVGVGTGVSVKGFIVKNCKISDAQQAGINFTNGTTPPEDCKVIDCIITGSNKIGGSHGQILLGDSKRCIARNNILGESSGETATFGIRVDVNAIDSEVIGNHVIDAVTSSYSLGSSTTYDIIKTFKNNTSDAAVTFQTGVGIIRMSRVQRGANIQRECMGSNVAPTSGNWKQGDRIYIETPGAGGTIGLVCVTSGTPGTWKTFGAITA